VIPNYNWKDISGWVNYLGKVTSHKMTENEMGYRGSKLNTSLFKKEQRADGSYCNFTLLKYMQLRCALMGLETGYQIKFLSKKLNKNKRNYSTLVQNSKLNPWFVTGFSDGESSFSVSIYIDKRIKGKLGWAVKPSFQISLNSKDMNLLLQLQKFFGCGVIVNKKLEMKPALE
jgi:hypothetical protein